MRFLHFKPRVLLFLFLIQLCFVILFFSIRSSPTLAGRLEGLKPSWSLFHPGTGAKSTPADIGTPNSQGSVVGAIIAAARADTDIAWIVEVRQQNWETFVYNVDAAYEGEGTLTVMRNKGHEAMVYLTYIIDHYDSLPPYAIFIHGHANSWHQEADIHSVIRNIRLPAVDKAGYVSLRCDWYPSCPAELKLVNHDGVVWGPGVHRQDAEDAISGDAWQVFFPGTPLPETVASQCCAQFAVTREAIRRNSKQTYERMRQWILETNLIDDVSGRVLEKLWAYIMTGREVNCPSPHTCACDYFGRCEKQKWPVPPPELGELPEDSRWP